MGCDHLSPEKAKLYKRWDEFYHEPHGGFLTALKDAIIRADLDNLRNLHKGFPELLDAFSVYTSNLLVSER